MFELKDFEYDKEKGNYEFEFRYEKEKSTDFYKVSLIEINIPSPDEMDLKGERLYRLSHEHDEFNQGVRTLVIENREDIQKTIFETMLLHVNDETTKELFLNIFKTLCLLNKFPAEATTMRHPLYSIVIIDYSLFGADEYTLRVIVRIILSAIKHAVVITEEKETEQELFGEDFEDVNYTLADIPMEEDPFPQHGEDDTFTDDIFDVGVVEEEGQEND